MSNQHIHHLWGCSPTPLARYLKAFGILRIVSEQTDSAARGWWQDEHFCLLTRLDRHELEQFFLTEYAPTAMVNPWGARSGFFPGSSEKTSRLALQAIRSSTLGRLSHAQAALAIVDEQVKVLGGEKPEEPEHKTALIDALRRNLRSGAGEWLSAVQTRLADRYVASPILGSGGNEGSGSYTSAWANAVKECVLERRWDGALNLFGTVQSPSINYRWGESFGHFDPAGGGSAWDLLLALEGSLVFSSSTTTTSRAGRDQRIAAPFSYAPHAVGAGSYARTDESLIRNGKETPGRGEQWFPTWQTPATYAEVQSLVSEGRCSLGRRPAKSILDAARAVRGLGTARGVSSFVRYGYLQRNNLATHFAVPLGTISTEFSAHCRLADDLRGWQDRLQREARRKGASARLAAVERRLADSVFEAITSDNQPHRWQQVLRAAAAAEAVQCSGTGFEAGPIPPLSPEWLDAADDGSPEWRLAMAVGSAAAGYRRDGRAVDPVREHVAHLTRSRLKFETSDTRLARSPRTVMQGRDPLSDLCALLNRRIIESAQRADRHLPLVSAHGYEARLEDLAALVAGDIDLVRVSELGRSLMALRWQRVRQPKHRTGNAERPPAAWSALRLATLPWPLNHERNVPVEPALIRRLTNGDGSGALEIAIRRLRAAGLRPPLRAAALSPGIALRFAAALAFPISQPTARQLATSFEPTTRQESR